MKLASVVVLARLALGATPPNEFAVISGDGFAQSYPSAAWNGTNYLVAWTDNRNGNNDIYGARIAPDGTVLDPGGFPICTNTAKQITVYNNCVASDGTDWLVVWGDNRMNDPPPDDNIFAARVAADGTVLDTNGFQVSSQASCGGRNQMQVSVCYGGGQYLVAWASYGTSGGSYNAYACRVTTAGVPLDLTTSLELPAAGEKEYSPKVCFDGTNYLVAWSIERGGTNWDAIGARVATDGTILDALGIDICTNAQRQNPGGIAFDGTNFFVQYAYDERNGGFTVNSDVYANRVATDGTVLDGTGFPVVVTPGEQRTATVTFDGTQYVVVWRDDRNGNNDIYWARVLPDKTCLDGTGLVLCDETSEQTQVAVAFGGGKVLVVWQDLRGANADIYARFIVP